MSAEAYPSLLNFPPLPNTENHTSESLLEFLKLSSPANLFDKSLFTFCACEKVNACAEAYISPDIISVADVKPIVDIFCNVAPIANSSFVAVPDNTF